MQSRVHANVQMYIYTVSHADDLRDEKCTKSISAKVTFLVHPVLPTLRQRKTDRRKSTRHPRDNVFGKPNDVAIGGLFYRSKGCNPCNCRMCSQR